MYSTPKSASARVGGCRIAPLIAECPRGSFISNMPQVVQVLDEVQRAARPSSRPGCTPTPPVMTRVGIPSVCESTAVNDRTRTLHPNAAATSVLACRARCATGLLGAQRPARRAARAAVAGRRCPSPSLIAWTNSVRESQRNAAPALVQRHAARQLAGLRGRTIATALLRERVRDSRRTSRSRRPPATRTAGRRRRR